MLRGVLMATFLVWVCDKGWWHIWYTTAYVEAVHIQHCALVHVPVVRGVGSGPCPPQAKNLDWGQLVWSKLHNDKIRKGKRSLPYLYALSYQYHLSIAVGKVEEMDVSIIAGKYEDVTITTVDVK